MILTKNHARKVLEVVDAGLVPGVGNPKPGKMCVMAAISFALGEEHGDRPSCVHPVIRSFDIALNDSNWSSNKARAKGMRREAIAKLGSTEIDSKGWLAFVVEQHIRQIVPIPFRIAASMLPKFADSLNEAADRCEKEGTKDAAARAADAADAAAAAADAADAAAAATYAARAAAHAATYAADAARAAVRAATYAADAARAAEKRKVQKPDEILSLSAEIATQACIKFKTQGSKWLDIV